VVLHELRRGARTPVELRFVGEFARKVRTLTPTESQWLESAEVLSRVRHAKGYPVNKLPDLAFDTLIALSARDAGATLVTRNREDFVEIGKYVAFRAVYW
jgi:predicted nucleic acid-binding protein